ncbi:YfbK domain-containing protein [Magnetococcus marinus]|uniref:YfbK domain-containing protein n=1 Tax=Magnetococcus marinus TaxID=1124597 RepID=UPI0005A22C52|nr:YfbK domain-containing protein [Magnetococcus marinus]
MSKSIGVKIAVVGLKDGAERGLLPLLCRLGAIKRLNELPGFTPEHAHTNGLAKTVSCVWGDVKIQMEFTPAKVSDSHLKGYEGCMVKRQDLTNDLGECRGYWRRSAGDHVLIE